MCFQEFFCDEAGAVTVDWVVITAAAVAMAVACFVAFKDPMFKMMNVTAVYLGHWEDCQAGTTVIAALFGPPVTVCN